MLSICFPNKYTGYLQYLITFVKVAILVHLYFFFGQMTLQLLIDLQPCAKSTLVSRGGFSFCYSY